MTLKVFFDGGCRPNPGAIEIAVVAAGKTIIRRDLGHGSSMDAEWLALLEAVRVAQALDHDDVLLLGDAIGVIGQAIGKVKPRNAAQHYAVFQLLTASAQPRIRYVKRAQNLAGIALARTHDR